DIELVRVAVWLLGRMRRSGALTAVAGLRFHPDWAVRKQVAIALRRSSAFTELAVMAERDSDPNVRCIAGSLQVARAAYAERLSQFVNHSGGDRADQTSIVAHFMPLFLKTPLDPAVPVKSRAWIRRLLERIHL